MKKITVINDERLAASISGIRAITAQKKDAEILKFATNNLLEIVKEKQQANEQISVIEKRLTTLEKQNRVQKAQIDYLMKLNTNELN